jgi:hypothetical protein
MNAGDTARRYLAQLEEETMRRAWGDRTPDERRRIVLAAIVFGREFEARSSEANAEDAQRFLMSLMNAAIERFAALEGVDRAEATGFLGDVTTRDQILELNEVLESYEAGDSGKTLDALLEEAVQSRREKAIWSDHWSSG